MPGLDENGRLESSQLEEPIHLSELWETDEPTKIIAENKLEKWWLRAVFTWGPLALGSEVFTDNGVGNTITNTCLAVGTIIMVAGCVALILSERKNKPFIDTSIKDEVLN